jgi:sortase (surface protein transpeptidase)
LKWVKKYKVLVIAIAVICVLFGTVLGIRSHNLQKKAEVQAQAKAEQVEKEKVKEEKQKKEVKSYDPSLGVNSSSESKDGVKISDEVRQEQAKEDAEEEHQAELNSQTTPNYPTELRVYNHISVPEYAIDGTSWMKYANKVSLADFGSMWGSALTHEDVITTSRVVVGTDDVEKGHHIDGESPRSVPEILNNFDSLVKPHTAYTFTDLKAVKSLSDDHTAMLCTYEWYSVYGLKDELVVFEDISGSVPIDTIKAGDTFSFTAYGQNISHKVVNGKNVLLVQYSTF